MIVIPHHIYDDPLWEGPLAPLTQHGPKTRWGIILYVYTPPKEEACPGEGRCHGCVSWCVWCGTVSNVCDANEWPKPDPRQLYLPGLGVKPEE